MRNWTGSSWKYLSKLVLLKGCITIFEPTFRTLVEQTSIEDFEKPFKMAESAHEVYKEQGVLGGKSKSSIFFTPLLLFDSQCRQVIIGQLYLSDEYLSVIF